MATALAFAASKRNVDLDDFSIMWRSLILTSCSFVFGDFAGECEHTFDPRSPGTFVPFALWLPIVPRIRLLGAEIGRPLLG